MRVIIKYIGYLSELAGKREEIIYLEKPRKIKDIIKLEVNDHNIIYLVDGKSKNKDYIISKDSVLVVLPFIGGG